MKFSRYISYTKPVRIYNNQSKLCLFQNPGDHLFSHTVASAVPSAAYVLTIVFGMGTGVSHKRIDTNNF